MVNIQISMLYVYTCLKNQQSDMKNIYLNANWKYNTLYEHN